MGKQKAVPLGKRAMSSSVQAHSASIGRRVFRQEKQRDSERINIVALTNSQKAASGLIVSPFDSPASHFPYIAASEATRRKTLQHSTLGKNKKLPRFAKQLLSFVRMKGLEPPRLTSLDPKSNAATNYATCAEIRHKGTTLNRFLQI